MSELRLNLPTGEWVVFAPERAKRPEDFQRESPDWTHKRLDYKATCPFCPGHDGRTPGETLRYEDAGRWQVRCFPNRYPALQPGRRPEPEGEELTRTLRGIGHHEVIAESPLHNTTLALMSPQRVALVLRAWRQRYRSYWLQPETEHVVIFKNHGRSAGCSLEHPHSQVVGMPVIPQQVLARHNVASNYYNQHGRCVFCDEIAQELRSRERILAATDEFVAFVPFAAFSPFSVWIFPRRHSCSFAHTTDDQLLALGELLQDLLARLYYGLGDPDYNLVVRSSHPEIQGTRMFHWYITLVPRLAHSAGFELGTGMFINPSLPEVDAGFLREFKPPPLDHELDRSFAQSCARAQQTVEVVDLDNRVLGHVSRAQMREQNLLHRAVKIMVVNSRGEVFVHRRTSTKDLFPRMHDMFVGGVVESGESYEEAACRTLASEIGVEARPKFVCGHLHQGMRSRAWVSIYRLEWDGEIQSHPDHVEWSGWIPESELPSWVCGVPVVPLALDCYYAYQDSLREG
ncbi:MAG: galactose-1-phosphate uridylyltransferase [Vulcanimicrobiota bacterium]